MNILLYNTLCVKAAMGKKEACLYQWTCFFICTQCAEQFHSEQNINAKLIYDTHFFLTVSETNLFHINKIPLGNFHYK